MKKYPMDAEWQWWWLIGVGELKFNFKLFRYREKGGYSFLGGSGQFKHLTDEEEKEEEQILLWPIKGSLGAGGWGSNFEG